MDRVKSYRQIVQSLLTAYAAIPIANGKIDCYTVFDTTQDRYLVMNVGWDGYRQFVLRFWDAIALEFYRLIREHR